MPDALPQDTESFWAGEDASLYRFGWDVMPYAVASRFFAKVEKNVDLGWIDPSTQELSPCWIWTAGTHDKGYGRFWLGMIDGKRVWAYSHRISWEHFNGQRVPKGCIVDHKCNHKLCCNPEHLEPITNLENIERARKRRPWKTRNQYSKE